MNAGRTERDWAIRLHIYHSIVDDGRAPTIDETAAIFGISVDDARAAYHRLQRPHQIVLEPGSDAIRMAIPLSAIPTEHKVWADGKRLFANCAWDSLGVAAMLHADVEIEAPIGDTGQTIRYAIRDGSLVAPDDISVHFPLPLSRWFDDIVNT